MLKLMHYWITGDLKSGRQVFISFGIPNRSVHRVIPLRDTIQGAIDRARGNLARTLKRSSIGNRDGMGKTRQRNK